MDSKLLTKYLNYLHTESNRILKKDDIDKFDVDNLKRDLATLKIVSTTPQSSRASFSMRF